MRLRCLCFIVVFAGGEPRGRFQKSARKNAGRLGSENEVCGAEGFIKGTTIVMASLETSGFL